MPKYETLFKKIILERGLSYNVVAKMTGLNKNTISNYANGYRTPDLDTTCVILNCLGLEANSIYNLFKPCD